MRINKTVKAAVAVALFGCVGLASAAQDTTTFTVTANVNKNCKISATPIAFGTYDPLGTHASNNLDATGTVTITCTKGTIAKVALNLGGSPLAGARRMTDGSNNFLNYALFKPSAGNPATCDYVTEWGATIGTDSLDLAAAPDKTARNFSVCGRVAQNQDPVPGPYTDTVQATVDF